MEFRGGGGGGANSGIMMMTRYPSDIGKIATSSHYSNIATGNEKNTQSTTLYRGAINI